MKTALRVVAVVGAIGVLLVLVVAGIRQSGPRYQGRSAVGWVEQLHSTGVVARSEAESAVRALGTDAIPVLVEKLQARDSSLRSNVVAVLQRQNLVPVPSSSATQSRQDAVRGFEALGGESEAAVAALVRLLEDPRSADHASYALMQMNNRVIPALLIAVTNSGLQVRRRVIADLGHRHTNASGVEAALVDRLRQDPDPPTRSMATCSLGRIPNLSPTAIEALSDGLSDPVISTSAAQALGDAGTNALPAVPALERMLRDPRSGAMAAMAARQALDSIDPSVLARLGVAFVPQTNRYE